MLTSKMTNYVDVHPAMTNGISLFEEADVSNDITSGKCAFIVSTEDKQVLPWKQLMNSCATINQLALDNPEVGFRLLIEPMFSFSPYLMCYKRTIGNPAPNLLLPFGWRNALTKRVIVETECVELVEALNLNKQFDTLIVPDRETEKYFRDQHYRTYRVGAQFSRTADKREKHLIAHNANVWLRNSKPTSESTSMACAYAMVSVLRNKYVLEKVIPRLWGVGRSNDLEQWSTDSKLVAKLAMHYVNGLVMLNGISDIRSPFKESALSDHFVVSHEDEQSFLTKLEQYFRDHIKSNLVIHGCDLTNFQLHCDISLIACDRLLCLQVSNKEFVITNIHRQLIASNIGNYKGYEFLGAMKLNLTELESTFALVDVQKHYVSWCKTM